MSKPLDERNPEPTTKNKSEWQKYWVKEMQLCKENPYYFAVRYSRIGPQGPLFTTTLTEEEYNNNFKRLI